MIMKWYSLNFASVEHKINLDTLLKFLKPDILSKKYPEIMFLISL